MSKAAHIPCFACGADLRRPTPDRPRTTCGRCGAYVGVPAADRYAAGGRARAEQLTPERRRAIARAAAQARWRKKTPPLDAP